jgi:hypothetical protein
MQETYGLLNGLAFDQELPSIDLNKIIDSMAWSSEFRRSDYSFIGCTHNDESVRVGFRFLFQRAKEIKGPNQMIDKSTHEAQWVERTKQGYLVKEKQFLRKLMVLLHITGILFWLYGGNVRKDILT